MSMIDNTLAAQIPTFDPATPLAQAAQIQNQQAEAQAAQFKQRQTEIGSEARGLLPFVNTPDFPAKWAETADRMHEKGLLDDRSYNQWRNTPSPLLLKQMISSTEDPALSFRKDEAQRDQKNSDRTYGLAARAADRADQTPLEAMQERSAAGEAAGLEPGTPAYITYGLTGKLPDSEGGSLSLNPVYAKDKDGNTVLLQPGKNGVAVQSKLPEGVTLNGVDNETLSADAERLNAGDPNILKKYSNKGQGRVDLLRLNNEANRQRVAKGQDPIDLTQNNITMQGDSARERAAGTMEGRMAPASIEAQGAFKIASNALDNLWRTNNVPVNKLLQLGETAMSNPALKAAKVAVNTAVMTYSRAIAPTGVGTVDSQQHAREILDTADGPDATKAAFSQLAREVDMAHASPGIARQYFAAARKARSEGKPMPEMPQYQPAQPAAGGPPPEAIAALKQDPKRAADFDAYYGAGSAKAVLGR